MKNNVFFKPFEVTCCNYKYEEFYVPECNRSIYNDETGETLYIDYSGHSLLRSLQRRRQYSTDYIVEVLKAGFDEILSTKIGNQIYITNKHNNFLIAGYLYIGSKEDSYVFSIYTVVTFQNKKVKYIEDDNISVIHTEVPSLFIVDTNLNNFEDEK